MTTAAAIGEAVLLLRRVHIPSDAPGLVSDVDYIEEVAATVLAVTKQGAPKRLGVLGAGVGEGSCELVFTPVRGVAGAWAPSGRHPQWGTSMRRDVWAHRLYMS